MNNYLLANTSTQNSLTHSKMDMAANICMWVAIAICFGYPLQAGIPILLKIDTGFFNAFARGLYAIILSLLLIKKIISRRKIVVPLWLKFIIAFWIIYILRLFVDISLNNINFGARSKLWVYSMAIGNGLLPLVVVGLYIRNIDLRIFLKYSLYIIVLSNLFLIVLIYVQAGGVINSETFSSRVSVTGAEEDQLVINTILIGTYGNFLATPALFLLLKQSYTYKHTIIYLSMLLLGGFLIIIAASRGPLLYFVLLSVISLSYNILSAKNVFSKLVLNTFIFLLLGIFSNALLSELDDTAILQRVDNFINERKTGEKEARDYEWASAWDQFTGSPLIGDRYLNRYDNYYPHNIFLDVLMATGILGGIPFFIFIYLFSISIFRSFLNHNNINIIINLMILCVSFSAITTGGLFTISYFWTILPFAFRKAQQI